MHLHVSTHNGLLFIYDILTLVILLSSCLLITFTDLLYLLYSAMLPIYGHYCCEIHAVIYYRNRKQTFSTLTHTILVFLVAMVTDWPPLFWAIELCHSDHLPSHFACVDFDQLLKWQHVRRDAMCQ